MIRRHAGALGGLLLVLLLAAPAMAGGWAEIVVDARTETTPPIEGQPIDLGFTVLQHGETPAGWEQPTVHVSEAATGRSFDVPAIGSGPDGHFTATATIPASGFWTWSVTLRDLIVEPVVSTPIAVYTAAGAPPVLDPATVLGAIDQARRDVLSQATGTLSTELGRMSDQIDAQGARIQTLTGERDALVARVDALESASAPAGVPVLSIVLIAVLAGATAGFLMSWLAGRHGPRELQVSAAQAPSTRGSTPA